MILTINVGIIITKINIAVAGSMIWLIHESTILLKKVFVFSNPLINNSFVIAIYFKISIYFFRSLFVFM